MEEARVIGARIPRPVLPLIVVVLVAAGAVSIAGRGRVMPDSGPMSIGSWIPLIVGVLLLTGVVFGAAVMAGPASHASVPRGGVVAVLAVLAVIGLGYLAFSNLEGSVTEDTLETGPPLTFDEAPESDDQLHWSWGVAVLVLLAVVGVLLAALLLLRFTPRATVRGLRDADGNLAEQVRTAVAAGQVALGESDDNRAAIIACYAAMEAALRRRGLRRRIADTPTELLDCAAAANLLGPAAEGAAVVLTVLFQQARFSSRTLPATARLEAESALARLAEGLAAIRGREVRR